MTTVLVTRPKPDGEILCEKIREAGWRAIYLPTIDIRPPSNVTILKQQIAALDQFDWLIFISPQAVYQSADAIHAVWKHFPSQVRVAAVGPGTAQALQKHHLPLNIYPSSDWRSEGILHLPHFQQMNSKKIALIKGAGGRELLAEELSARGARVTSIIVYQRCLPQIVIEDYISLLPEIDIIVCTSNEIMKNLKILFQEKGWDELSSIPLAVVSERMVHYANKLGFKKIILAKNASHDAIISILAQEKDRLCQMKKKK